MVFSKKQIESVLHENITFKRFSSCTRINGGYSKYSYKIVLDGNSFIFQIFKNPDDILQMNKNNGLEYLFPGGFNNYLKSVEILEELNIFKPQTIFMDRSKKYFEFDCVLNEFIEFDSYSGFEKQKNKNTLKDSLFKFGSALGSLKKYKRTYPGALSTDKSKFIPNEIVFNVTCDCLDNLPERSFFQDNKIKIIDKLEELNQRILPRDAFYLIHSDFKPDNFRFDKNGNIYLIDFESLQYFDIEFEFSQFITPDFIVTNNEYFKSGYFKDRKNDLDESRLEFYQIYRSLLQIVNCSNTLVFKDKKEPTEEIIESNIQTLKTLL